MRGDKPVHSDFICFKELKDAKFAARVIDCDTTNYERLHQTYPKLYEKQI